jgi:AcrR family transcriptional regulator
MPRQSDARTRMIQSAALLFRERGIEGTAFADVLERSGAPRGSVYHHFPGGKQQLAEEATRWAGDFMTASIAAAIERDEPLALIENFTRVWIEIVRQSDFEAGCPIVAATLEGRRTPAARAAAATAFGNWEELIAGAIQRHDIPADRAHSLATLIIASVEGAVVLARAERSTAPLERVASELLTLVEIVIPSGS